MRCKNCAIEGPALSVKFWQNLDTVIAPTVKES